MHRASVNISCFGARIGKFNNSFGASIRLTGGFNNARFMFCGLFVEWSAVLRRNGAKQDHDC